VSASLDLAAPKLGSGARFKKLSSTLSARGASDPDALAAFIGRKRYGPKGMGKLSAGKQLANPDLGIYLAAESQDDAAMTCPACGHSGSASEFGSGSPSGAPESASPGVLRTPAPGTGGVRKGVPLTVKGGAAHALAGSTRAAVELAAGTVRRPIHGPMDVLVKRAADGTAILRHRNGGATIASLRRTPEGKWLASVNGRDLEPRDHQRTALMEAVGTWNSAVKGAVRPQAAPLQPEPQQSALMAEYGIPAVRSAAFATPTAGASDGPRVTTSAAVPAGPGDDGKPAANGLNAKGQGIYKKLIAKGFPPARALQFAKQSQNFGKAGG
jgi:hypothetical protein